MLMKMMNLLNKMRTAVVIGMVVLASGCSDFLDVDPDSALKQDQLYTDYKDIFALKFGMYDMLQSTVDQMFVIGEAPSDLIVAGPGAKGAYKDVAEFIDNNVSPSNQYLDWTNYYQLINHCNDALVRLPKLRDENPLWLKTVYYTGVTGQVIYDMVVAEVLWMRAYAYLQLVRSWGDVPFFTTPMYTVEDAKNSMSVFTDRDLILNQLEKDLLWVSDHSWLNWNWTNYIYGAWNHQTMNSCSALNLLADVYMVRGKYNEAWSNNCLLKIVHPGFYSPANEHYYDSWSIAGTAFQGGKSWQFVLWRVANEFASGSGGSIWREQGLVLAFDTEDLTSHGGQYKEAHSLMKWANNRSEDGGAYVVKPSRPAVANWLRATDQWRGLNASFAIDNYNGRTDTIIWKFVGLNSAQGVVEARRGTDRKNGIGNVHIYRTADLWLRGAECANRLGLTAEALSIVNQVRGRVGVIRTPLGLNATVNEVEDAIMTERALELAFEGYRWHDLARVSRTRRDPSYLIDKVVEKELNLVKREQMRARLELQATAADPADWFLLPIHEKVALFTPNL